MSHQERFIGGGAPGAKLTDTLVASSSVFPTAAISDYRINTSGATERKVNAGSFTFIETWLLTGASSEYQCKFTLQSGVAPTIGTLNTLLPLSGNQTLELSDSTAAVGVITSVILVEIFRIATGARQAFCTLTLTADCAP